MGNIKEMGCLKIDSGAKLLGGEYLSTTNTQKVWHYAPYGFNRCIIIQHVEIFNGLDSGRKLSLWSGAIISQAPQTLDSQGVGKET